MHYVNIMISLMLNRQRYGEQFITKMDAMSDKELERYLFDLPKSTSFETFKDLDDFYANFYTRIIYAKGRSLRRFL